MTTMRMTRSAVSIAIAVLATVGCSAGPDDDEEIRRYELQLRRAHDRAVKQLGWNQWDYAGTNCADGSTSGSIGQRGACSWHGGVVTLWVNDSGGRIMCSGSSRPPTVEDAAMAAELGEMLVCQ